MSKAALVIAQLVLGASLAQAQSAALSGVVKDTAGHPIGGVEITALKPARITHTDTAGRFFLPALPPGPVDIRFRRLAFEPAVLQIQLPALDTTDVEISLGVAVTQLTAVLVEATASQSAEMAAFQLRRREGVGHFITRSDIENRHPMLLSDMVRSVPGAILYSAQNGRTVLRFSRSARNCAPQFYIDGIPATEFSIDDMTPGDVEGVELYSGPAGVPPQYNRLHNNSICGTILIWSRDPSAARKP